MTDARADDQGDSDPGGSDQSAAPARGRYEATVHATRVAAGADADQALAALDLDRVPDPEGGTRVLVDDAEIARLVAEGFEVRVLGAVPAGPLDPDLVATDDAVAEWLGRRMAAVRARGTR